MGSVKIYTREKKNYENNKNMLRRQKTTYKEGKKVIKTTLEKC